MPTKDKSGNVHGFLVPADSTDIAVGDAVMLDASKRLTPITKTSLGISRFVGFAVDRWSRQDALNKYGTIDAYLTPNSFTTPGARPAIWTNASTDLKASIKDLLSETPSSQHKVHVLVHESVFRIPILESSGVARQRAYASVVDSGSMMFTLVEPLAGPSCVPVGHLQEDFGNASAGGAQLVVIASTYQIEYPEVPLDWINPSYIVQGKFGSISLPQRARRNGFRIQRSGKHARGRK